MGRYVRKNDIYLNVSRRLDWDVMGRTCSTHEESKCVQSFR
jgi:hypothetical protein